MPEPLDERPLVRRAARVAAGLTASAAQIEREGVDRGLLELCAGRALGGVAWSHLRTATPSVRAERCPGGWSLSGFQPWCTGWGLTDVVLVGALVDDTDEVLLGLVPAAESPALSSAGELRLAMECCTALVTARGGQGMDLAEPAQRLLRAAAFQIVHSQAAHVRTATLAALVA